jgi:Flp pilus assembly pilin Flp
LSTARKVLRRVSRGVGAEEGQALLEYALIVGLVALLTFGVLQALGTNVSGTLGHISNTMSNVLNS